MTKHTGIKVAQTALVAAMIANYEPYQQALDANHDNTMGHEPPSVTNRYFQMMIGSMIQQNWRLLFSDPNQKEASQFDTIPTTIAKVSQNLQGYVQQRYNGDWDEAAGDPNYIRQLDYIDRLACQEKAASDMYDQLMQVYKHFFKVDWKPQFSTQKPAVSNDKVKAAAAKVQERLAQLAKDTKVEKAA